MTETESYLKERSAILHESSKAAVPVNALNAVVLTLVIWPAAGGPLLLGWLAAIMILSAFRVWFHMRYRGQGEAALANDWLPWHLVGVALTGWLWGATFFLFPIGALSIHFVFAMFLLAGMTAGATSSGMSHIPAVLAFNLPALLTAAVYCMLPGTFEWFSMSAVMLVYLAFTVRIGANGENAARREIAQNKANAQLANFLEHRSAELRSILDAMDTGVCVYDASYRLTHWNPAFAEQTSIPHDFLESNPCLEDVLRQQFGANVDDSRGLERLITDQIARITELRHQNHYVGDSRSADGRTLEIEVSPMPDGGFVLTFTDISERANHLQEILHIATHDAVTGLANRAKFQDELATAIAQTARNECSLVVMMIDLDDFKLINDSMGHPAGDELLRQVAQRLKGSSRETDLVARIGGDEFAILGRCVDGPFSVSAFAERVLKALSQPYLIHDRSIHASASIGATTYPSEHTGETELIAHADAALYRAKKRGKHCFELFDKDMNAELLNHKRIEQEIDRALENGEFELYFQPLVELGNTKPLGAEVLIRWNHPEQGLVPPFKFLPVAEATGQINAITTWVIDSACAFIARELMPAGLPTTLSINLSARDFQGTHLVTDVIKALEQHRVPANALEMEITETLVLPDLDRALEVVAQLAELGVPVVIDDFGTGFSSMSYLKHFRASKLKLDRSFIIDCEHSREDQAIIAAAISLGHSLDMRIVAEGIETDEQMRYLIDSGCDIGQGYLFGKPQSGSCYIEWLLNRQQQQ